MHGGMGTGVGVVPQSADDPEACSVASARIVGALVPLFGGSGEGLKGGGRPFHPVMLACGERLTLTASTARSMPPAARLGRRLAPAPFVGSRPGRRWCYY